jgi:hypothetical protein
MKNKTTLILGGVFLLLAVIYFAAVFRPEEVTQGATPLFKGKTPDIDKLEITNPKGESVTLEKQNEIWNITNPFSYKASVEVMQQVMEGLQNTLVDGVVSTSPDAQKQFGVEDSTSTSLKAYSGGKIVLDALIGRFTPELSHTYVRMRDSKEITLWRGIFSRTVNRDVDEWRDRTIFSFNAGDVTAIKAADGKNTRQLTLSDSTWTYTENGKQLPVDQARAKELVTMLAALSCDAFAAEEDIPRAGSTPPDTRVSFTVRNGDTHSFDLWTPKAEGDNGRFLVRTEKGDILFRFYEYRGSNLKVDYTKLKPQT